MVMAKVNFLTKGKNESSSIYVRFTDGRKIDLTSKTRYSINSKYWSTKKNWVSQKAIFKDKLNLAEKLDDLKKEIIKSHNSSEGKTIDRYWLTKIIDEFRSEGEEESLLFRDFISRYKDDLGDSVSTGTIRNYNTSRKRFEKFEVHKKTEYNIYDIDLTFHSEYKKFAKKNLGLSINSIAKDFRQFKTVCRDAMERGHKINEQALSSKFKGENEKKLFVTLNEKEIDLIRGFKGSNHLENARDWLVIGCWSGCRVGDLMRLSDNNILTNKEGTQFIQYTQSKTKKTVKFPLHPHIKEILNRLGGFPRPISDQKFNDYIKDVCKDDSVKITYMVEGSKLNDKKRKETGYFPKNELISSHICRRSFSTNHYDKLSNKAIMSITGHATETMFLEYIGETENDHFDEFIDVWKEKDTNVRPYNLRKNDT
ncbi:MAG: integrase [Cyclobacteriaceae bacterium]|jgi:integrase